MENAIKKLTELFSKLPTVGPRTASRFVFFLLKNPKQTEELIKAIKELKEKVKICPSCHNSFESEKELCDICSDPKRDKSLLFIVEKEVDLESIEKTRKYQGLYFILGKNNLEEKVEEIKKRIKDNNVKEIILGLNPTPEGQNTSLFLKRKLQFTGVKMTQLQLGIPLGGELEYADEETLSSAFLNRS